MLFNSLEFGIFLCISFVVYWNIRNIQIQNFYLLVCSYVFYAWWDWRFLGLIALSSLTDFVIGTRLHAVSAKRKKKMLLLTSLLINLGMLGFFKYYNFFLDSLIESLNIFGIQLNTNSLSIILPVGISFYTFQSLSYTIDIYKGKTEATRNLVNFFAYVSFFPQLVAGPIERAKNLLPQFAAKRTFDYPLAVDGMRQIL